MVKRVRATISGRVQGVFYRAYAQEQAMTLGLKGFVRNLRDGSVELEAEGEEDAILQLLHWCRQGPPSARVDDVRTQWIDILRDSGGFLITV